MNKKFIYLAGPIADCDIGEANDWRTYVQENLSDNIVGISPLRCEPLVGDKYAMQYDDIRFGTPAAISAKNLYDTRNCDMVLAYMPVEIVEKKPSIGTTLELGWAMGLQKPVVLVSTAPSLVNHPLIIRNVDWVLNNFDDAFDVIEGIFSDYL